MFTDITTQKKAEEGLKEREENLRTTLNSIGDAVISTDLDGNIVSMNPIAQELTGWSEDAAPGKPINEVFNIVNAKTGETVENPVGKILEEGKIVGLANHTVLISKDGKEYQIADSGSPIKDDDGNITGVVLVFRDVTQSYRMQQKLRESEEKYSILTDNMVIGLVLHDSDTQIIFSNPTASEILGLSKDQMIGKKAIDPLWSFVQEDGSPLPLAEYPVNKAIKSKKTIKDYKIGIKIPGEKSLKWVLVNAVPVLDKNGIISYVYTFADFSTPTGGLNLSIPELD